MAKAKKSFQNLGRGKSVRSLLKDDEDILQSYDELKKSPDSKKVDEVILKINKSKISPDDKEILINSIMKEFISVFNFDNCPDDYEELKKEAKFLSGLTQYSFLLMAQRLLKIRDDELYKKDGYLDFIDFIRNELSIAKRTVYDYINLLECFGVRTFALDANIQYTKLLPVIPLLKSENIEIPKSEIKKRFLQEIKNKSAREIKIETKELKEKYGILKRRQTKKNDLSISDFINWILLKKDFNILENEQLKQLALIINEKIK